MKRVKVLKFFLLRNSTEKHPQPAPTLNTFPHHARLRRHHARLKPHHADCFWQKSILNTSLYRERKDY